MKVRKRNGKIVEYDGKKIINAINKAFKAAEVEDIHNIAFNTAFMVTVILEHRDTDEPVTIDEIQNLVEYKLAESCEKYGIPMYKVAKKYILYRDRRDKDRESINKLSRIFSEIINISDNDTKKSNANIDGNTPAGQMYIFGSESSKDHASKFIISPKFVQAHELGAIHIHDLDYYSMKAWNCNHISLKDLFSHDYIYTNDSVMRRPRRISSYAALAAIALQSEQNEQYGGQSIGDFDYGMAEGVALTFRETFKRYYEIINRKKLENIKDDEICMNNKLLKTVFPYVYEKALERTREETHEAMAAFTYNLCSMHARAGNQIVFSSINYGTDTSAEGRMVIEEILNAIDEGLGDGSTAIFPISVFKVKDGVNFSKEDWQYAQANWQDALEGKLKYKTPNFDLFIKACKVSARRLFPNFLFLDSTFNKNKKWDIADPDRYKYELATMGCRTRVYSDINGEKTCLRRGNLSFTTINLPMLAIEAMLEEKDKVRRLELFFLKLDYYIQMVHDQLKERYDWQCSSFARQFPFIVKNGTVMGTENIGNEEYADAKIGQDILKHGTLGIGYVGLAETLVALMGCHHGESCEAQELGLKIVGRIREACDKFTEVEKLNYGCFASPAESYSGKALRKCRDRFGIIPKVTDREYFTNSNHCPVYYPIKAIDKIRLEAPYHELANAGNITYVELDGTARKNVKAFASIVAAMHDNNIGYGSVNHDADRCEKCGYEGQIKEKCPRCGNDDEKYITNIARITGYLTGNVKSRWNSAKAAELTDRVKHT